MKISLEQIDELRSRVNVTYEEAKSTLEKNDGDLIKSIIELEKKNGRRGRAHKNGEYNKDGFTNFLNRLLELKIIIKSKKGSTILDLPVVLVLIAFIFAFWIVIPGFIIALITSCKIKVYRDKNSMDVDGIKNSMKETVEKIKVKSEEFVEKYEEHEVYEEPFVEDNRNDEIEENEIIIE